MLLLSIDLLSNEKYAFLLNIAAARFIRGFLLSDSAVYNTLACQNCLSDIIIIMKEFYNEIISMSNEKLHINI